MPRKVPRVNWFPRSRVKLRSNRGPICPAASDNAAMVIENTVPATPIVEDATAPSRVRAPVPPPLYSHGLLISQSGTAPSRSRLIRLTASRMPATTIAAGSSQKVSPRS